MASQARMLEEHRALTFKKRTQSASDILQDLQAEVKGQVSAQGA